jgi:membrane protein required for colicin V production
MTGMDGFDIAALVVIVLSTLFGLARGFVRTVLLILLWVLALVLAFRLAPPLARLLVPAVVGDPFFARIVAFVALVLVVRLFGGLALHGLERDLAAHQSLSKLDHVLGALFGFLRGVAFVVLALLAVRALGFHASRLAPRSRLVPVLRPWVRRTGRLLAVDF